MSLIDSHFSLHFFKKARQSLDFQRIAFESFATFWHKHPALLYGLTALSGAVLALDRLIVVCLIIMLVIVGSISLDTSSSAYAKSLRICLALVIFIGSFFSAASRYLEPDAAEGLNEWKGSAHLHFTGLSFSKTHFGTVWKYKGVIDSFSALNPKGEKFISARNLPIRMSLPTTAVQERPNADFLYQVNVKLKKDANGYYSISPLKNTTWSPLQQRWDLVELRHTAKEGLQKYIQSVISNRHIAQFLAGISTGEFDDTQLSYELGRFGLMHLMAISGLHFSIIASILGFFFMLFMHRFKASIILIVLLSSYFAFLGNSPSVTRAWIAIVVGLAGFLIFKRSPGLNSLGLALLWTSLVDPILIRQIAFQFSFAVTAAILIWHEPCNKFFKLVFRERALSEIADSSMWTQHAYCLLCCFRAALALTVAVNLAAFPLTLYHFHVFPWMGLVYNLFFPFLVSISLLLLICGCTMGLLLIPISQWVHYANEKYTGFLLNFVFGLPKGLDHTLVIDSLSSEYILVYMLGLFGIGIWLSAHPKDELIVA